MLLPRLCRLGRGLLLAPSDLSHLGLSVLGHAGALGALIAAYLLLSGPAGFRLLLAALRNIEFDLTTALPDGAVVLASPLPDFFACLLEPLPAGFAILLGSQLRFL